MLELVGVVGAMFLVSMILLALTYSIIAPTVTDPLPKRPPPVKPVFIKYKGSYDCDTFEVTVAELRKHDKCSLFDADNNDYWMVVGRHVYDLSLWVERHPGGDMVCMGKNIDATTLFQRSHGDFKYLEDNILPSYCIGVIKDPETLDKD